MLYISFRYNFSSKLNSVNVFTETKYFLLKKIVNINPFFFINNDIFLPQFVTFSYFLSNDKKYFIQNFLFFKLRRHLLFLKQYALNFEKKDLIKIQKIIFSGIF